MNVTCPECHTTYRIDPLKVPAGGVRAQCANCPAEFLVRVRWAEAEVSPVPSTIAAVKPEGAPEAEAAAVVTPEATSPVADSSGSGEFAVDEAAAPETDVYSGGDTEAEAEPAEAVDTFVDSIADSFDAALEDSGGGEDDSSAFDDGDDPSLERIEVRFDADEATITMDDAPAGIEIEPVPDPVETEGYGEIAISVDGRSYHEPGEAFQAGLTDAVGFVETVEIAETIEIGEDGTVTEVIEIVDAVEVVALPEAEPGEETEESADDESVSAGDEPSGAADDFGEEAPDAPVAGERTPEEEEEDLSAGGDTESDEEDREPGSGGDAPDARFAGETDGPSDSEKTASSGAGEEEATSTPEAAEWRGATETEPAADDASTLEDVESPAGFAPVEHSRADADLELPPAPFGSADPHTRAKRLARALVSDIVVYHSDRRDRSIRAGTVRQEFREEIRKSWDEYVSHVGNQMARDTSYFRDALNELLAGGQQLF